MEPVNDEFEMDSLESDEYGTDSNGSDLLKIKEDLILALDEIQSTGSFMTSRRVLTSINPGLHIPSAGVIGLPISTRDVKAMIQSCHMSPYGQGTETLVNESVRESWQLDADQFFFKNPLWDVQIGTIMHEAISGLGLNADPLEIKAELYKLLVYEEGAFFLPHQDSEKADGMFGTLVVCLPSKHEGGDVIASHKGDSIKFQTAPESEFGLSWAA
jgi:hypothetical protein